MVGGQPRQIVLESPSPKQNELRCGSSGSATALQAQSPDFKPQGNQKKKKKKKALGGGSCL
jgi:hypothetical protein